MKRRTLATLKLDPYEMLAHENREWLAEALTMIASEIRKGEHLESKVLEIYEAEALFEKRRSWTYPS